MPRARDMGSYFSFSDFTRPVTALGSDFADTLGGGEADDIINPGNAPEYDGNVLRASPGSDLFDLGSMGPNRYLDLTYETLNGPISVIVNGSAGTASVAKPGGESDSLINLGNVLGYGFGLWGTQGDDSYTLNPGAGNWMQVMGMAGNDTFNLTLEGVIRLTYAFGYEDDPFTGIVANLGAGVISNDGFGFTDTLNITEGSGRLELHGTAFADDIIGSHRDERFILEAGDDTLDAGGAGTFCAMTATASTGSGPISRSARSPASGGATSSPIRSPMSR